MGDTNNKTNTNIDQSNHLTNTTTSPQIPPDLINLKDACDRKDVNKIMIIIKQRPDLINEEVNNFPGDTLLMMSCKYGWYDIVKYIISNHSNTININQQNKYGGYTALFYAVSKGKVNCVRLLLSHPMIDVNIKYHGFNKTVLWYCGNRDCYDLLLPHYPTMKDHVKRMAWLYSMCCHKIGGVKEVKDMMQELSHDVLYEMRDDMGMLLYEAAAGYRGDEEKIEYLLSSYSDVININIQNKYNGWTALYNAVYKGRVNCVRLLLSHPMIDVNIQNKDGDTAFHRAVLSNRVGCIHILLNHPTIDVTVRNKEGKTAYEIDPSIKTKMKVMSLLPHQKLVRWNRSKIMLVGQGRAGKTALANNLAGRWMGETASTIGAEQMDMRLLYGGVKEGRLEEYERPKQELEALLAELSYYDDNHRNREHSLLSFSLASLFALLFSRPIQSTIADHNNVKENAKLPHSQAFDKKNAANDESLLSDLAPTDKNILPKRVETEKEVNTFAPSIKLSDFNLDEFDLHYRKLQEVDTASSYKLLLVDFGGQSIFNVLHGFFMSRYGVYVVVFDMKLFLSGDAAGRESCRKELKFWLNSITMHTCDNNAGSDKTAPVVIVGTRGDKVVKEEDHEKISSELDNMI